MTRSRRRLRLPIVAAALASALAMAGLSGATASAVSVPVSVTATGAGAAASAPGSAAPASGRHLVAPEIGLGGMNTVTDYTSHNWDGYFATAANDGTDFTSISAQWVVPAVTCTSKTSYAGFWIGFDGWWNDSVEQDGTDAECVRGVASYNVWWEMYPYNQVQNGFSITPGDTIKATVSYSAGTKLFTMIVVDVTNGQTLNKSSKCHSDQNGCQRSSADVISEDIGGGTDTDGLYYLPNYGTATYTNISVTDTSGHVGSLSDSAWQAGLVNEVSSTSITKQSTSALSSNGTSFKTTWLHV